MAAVRSKTDSPDGETGSVAEPAGSFRSHEPLTGPIRACAAVLLVEDDPVVRENVQSLLAHEGYRVLLAENGKRALEILDRFPDPVLVLADLAMPVMDGWDLLSRLRQNDRLAMLPVVVVSAVQSGPPGYQMVKKPVRPGELLAIVQQYCRRDRA